MECIEVSQNGLIFLLICVVLAHFYIAHLLTKLIVYLVDKLAEYMVNKNQ